MTVQEPASGHHSGRTLVENAEMTAPAAVWFGPTDRPLLGWLHRPVGHRARGGVILCPPFAAEMNFSHYLLRVLARRLASAGLAVLRFDYDGTGQSAGEVNDPLRKEAWTASVVHAGERLRAEGVPWLAGIGLRMGATLLAQAAADACELDVVLLWDPCLSGRTFLKEHVALQSTVCSEPVDELGVEIPGYLLTPETVAAVRELELPQARGGHAGRTLVLLDGSRPQNGRIRRRLGEDGVEWREYAEEAMVLDIGERQYTLPVPIIDEIVAWVDECAPEDRVELKGTVTASTSALVGGSGGTPVREEVITIGPLGLVGIASEPAARGAAGDLPTILLLSMAAEPSIGPARLWVQLARAWASAGMRTVRFDFSGIGESPCRPGRPERHIYAPAALDDIAEAAAAVSPGDPRDVIVVGVCSGAYSALAIAPHLRPRGVVAINPVLTVGAFSNWAPSPGDASPSPPAGLTGRARRRLRALAGRVLMAARASGRGSRWRHSLRDRLPPTTWAVVYKLRLAHSPSSLITPIIEAGVPLLLLCGNREARLPRTRTPAAFQRLEKTPGSHFTVVPDLDHSLRDAASRMAAGAAISTFLQEITCVDLVGCSESQPTASAAPPAAAAA